MGWRELQRIHRQSQGRISFRRSLYALKRYERNSVALPHWRFGRTGAAGAAAYKGVIAVAAIAVVSGIVTGVMVMNKPTPVSELESASKSTDSSASASASASTSTSDASEVETTPDPVNGAVSSASRKNKGASIAVRGSSFWVK